MRAIKFTQLLLTIAIILIGLSTFFSRGKGVNNPNIDVVPMTSNSISLNELINRDNLYQGALDEKVKTLNSLEKEVSVFYNEEKIDYNVSPQFLNGRLMLPIRQTLEAMGFDVEWSNKDMSIKVTKKDVDAKAFINENNYITDDENLFILSDSPIIIDGRTMIPIEFFYETLGLDFGIKDGNLIFFKEDLLPLNSHKGYLVRATEGDGFITYFLSEEKNGEESKRIKVMNNNSFYQKTPVIGNYINIIGNLKDNNYIGLVIY